jgi:hypothetical protein
MRVAVRAWLAVRGSAWLPLRGWLCVAGCEWLLVAMRCSLCVAGWLAVHGSLAVYG